MPDIKQLDGKAKNLEAPNSKTLEGLVDIELNTEEATMLGPYILPETGSIFGPSSRRESHRLYLADSMEPARQFKDTDGTVLVEFQVTGAQTMLPGSVHPSGETIEWYRDEGPAEVDGPFLTDDLGKLATATLLSRHLPQKGSRQETALALAGWLLRDGWEQEEASNFIRCVAMAAKEEDIGKRVEAADAAARKLALGQPTPGVEKLGELLDREVLKRVREWLQLREEDAGQFETRKASDKLFKIAMNTGAIILEDLESGADYIAPDGNGTEVWVLDSEPTQKWLAKLWRKESGTPVSREDVKKVIFNLSTLEKEESVKLGVRVAWQKEKELLWYDLGSSAVRIASDGWEVEENPPILFKRYLHQLNQVTPEKGGDFGLIDDFLPVAEGSDESLLIKVWILACLSPDRPRPIQDLAGPQGSGKSTVARLEKLILDPSRVSTVRRLNDHKDLQQQLAQTWALFVDNLSGIGADTSDFLAAAVSGDAVYTRKLYTNDEAHIFAYQRVLCLNGISHTAERPDLLERTLMIGLQGLNEDSRQDEDAYWSAVNEVLPSIMGGAFDILSRAIGLLPEVNLKSRSRTDFRMKDFAKWGFAIAEAAGWGGDRFLDAYAGNMAIQQDEAIAASLVAQCILVFMSDKDEWQDTPTEFKKELDEIAKDLFNIELVSKLEGWPKDVTRLSNELTQLAPILKAKGIEFSRRKGKTRYQLNKVG